jgi:membrane-associated protease RseP (regulator of RpoE activity)
MSTRIERFQNEMAAGGSVTENPPDERPTRWVQFVGIGAWLALFTVLGVTSPWALVFVVGLLVSVLLHEVGHYWTARRSGMRVTQFFIGFGPRVWSFHRDGIEYGLRALPLGAFVRIIGMNNLDEVPETDEAFTYRQQSYPKRMWVITAGSAMHVIIAFATIISVYGLAGRVQESGRVTIGEVVAGSPAALAGLEIDDIVLAIDGQEVATADAFRGLLGDTPPGTAVTLDILRQGTPAQLEATLVQHPSAAEGEILGYLGVRTSSVDRVSQTWGDAFSQGPRDMFTGVGQAVVGIAKVVNPINVWGHLVGTNDDISSRPATVVGAARLSDDAGDFDGWAGILSLLAAVNISVGVFNMFPLLPLDGGHAAIATYERIRERKGKRYFADVAKLMPVVSVTVALLAFMFLTGLYLDTVKL